MQKSKQYTDYTYSKLVLHIKVLRHREKRGNFVAKDTNGQMSYLRLQDYLYHRWILNKLLRRLKMKLKGGKFGKKEQKISSSAEKS